MFTLDSVRDHLTNKTNILVWARGIYIYFYKKVKRDSKMITKHDTEGNRFIFLEEALC